MIEIFVHRISKKKKSRTFRAHSRHEVHILMNPGIVNLSRFGKDEKIGVIYKINI